MKVVAIIQARMGSTRLPGKVMMPVCDKSLFRLLVERVRSSRLIDELWLATSVDPSNDVLVREASCIDGLLVYRGKEADVLSRYADIAVLSDADYVVRLTGDCPLLDSSIIDLVINFMLNNSHLYDYVSNALKPTYPDGLDVEVFKVDALLNANKLATASLDREHVTPLIHCYHVNSKNPRVGHYIGEAYFSHLRWTVDESCDYELVKEIFEHLYYENPRFGWLEVVSLLTKMPKLLEKNNLIMRNEGYIKAATGEV